MIGSERIGEFRRALEKASPETRELLRLFALEVATNLEERYREADCYYGTADERRSVDLFNDVIDAVVNAIRTEATQLAADRSPRTSED